MNFIVEFFLKARRELSEASEWYDEKQLGLGERFEQEVFKKIDLIKNNPLHYPVKRDFTKLKPTPFRI